MMTIVTDNEKQAGAGVKGQQSSVFRFLCGSGVGISVIRASI